jgi:hypothetical protein
VICLPQSSEPKGPSTLSSYTAFGDAPQCSRDIEDFYYVAIPILNLSEYANLLLFIIHDLTII